MPLYSLWFKPDEDLCLMVQVKAESLEAALAQGAEMNSWELLTRKVEWIDGGFTLYGVHEGA